MRKEGMQTLLHADSSGWQSTKTRGEGEQSIYSSCPASAALLALNFLCHFLCAFPFHWLVGSLIYSPPQARDMKLVATETVRPGKPKISAIYLALYRKKKKLANPSVSAHGGGKEMGGKETGSANSRVSTLALFCIRWQLRAGYFTLRYLSVPVCQPGIIKIPAAEQIAGLYEFIHRQHWLQHCLAHS